MYHVYLGLGSNVGNRLEYLQHAVDELRTSFTIGRVSSVYETEPMGFQSKHFFYNIALQLQTPTDPVHLLHKVKYLEKKLGRSPASHLKDREIDIDILLFENLYYEDHEIEVPHPELHHRRFVLVPLNDIASAVLHPIFGESVETLLRRCPASHRITKVSEQVILNH